ncbi:MAG: ABC transporter ATP-binding protein/permease [Crocinitomicaceae bacterium]|nr:ABC transporter ATP-binding protein/permease [Crocinitomicaceae bacterium]
MKSLSYLNKYFIKYKWHLLLGTLFTVVSNYFGVKMPVYVKETVDNFMTDTNFTRVDSVLLLSLKLGGIYMFLSLAKGFFLFLMRQTIIVMSRLIEFDLKNEIFNQYQNLDTAFYKRNSTGDLMNRISEDVSQVRMYLGPGIMYTINLIVLFFMVIYQMIAINPVLTFFVLLPLPIMSVLIYFVSTKMNSLSGKVQEEQSNLSTIAQESFAGMRVIKAYSRENEIWGGFSKSSEEYKKRTMKLVFVNALFMPTMMFLIGLSTLIAIYLGGLMVYDKTISLGGIVAFIFFVNNLTWPFASIGWVTSLIQRAAASQKRINEFLEQHPEVISTNNTSFEFGGKVEFSHVSFTYSNTGIQALKNIDFTVERGETLAIIGKTGSGKSTILNLLLRQFDATTGKILVDDKEIQAINLQSFRDQSGVVPQDVFLFSDTIKNNLKFGSVSDDVSMEELIDVVKQAHVYHNIQDFPDQFETILGERGVNLSGGQKQRISIARALLRNPKLLLLDDCLSAVDTETEETILTNLKKMEKSRTTIIVSHRISAVRNANKILVIDGGEVIESGSHNELLAKNGFYAEMYTKQLAEEKE